MTAKFSLDQVVMVTAAEHELLEKMEPKELAKSLGEILDRHVSGDWGDVDKHDWKVNEEAVKSGARILSAYTVAGVKLWIISDAAWTDNPYHREVTTILRPEDY